MSDDLDGLRPQPTIKAQCASCLRSWEAIGTWLRGQGIVSPTGIEHIGLDDGVTACGKDATGDEWWWPI